MNPLPESAVELAARLMCEADNGRSPPHAYMDMARAALPALREAVAGDLPANGAALFEAARCLGFAQGRGDKPMSEYFEQEAGKYLAALTEQENRNER